jgi:hypothetical protein
MTSSATNNGKYPKSDADPAAMQCILARAIIAARVLRVRKSAASLAEQHAPREAVYVACYSVLRLAEDVGPYPVGDIDHVDRSE